jgi:hypothetical protein
MTIPLTIVRRHIAAHFVPHDGIAGFGAAAAFAKAWWPKDDARTLRNATKDICGSDEQMTKLAESSVNLQAEDA